MPVRALSLAVGRVWAIGKANTLFWYRGEVPRVTHFKDRVTV